MQKIPQHFDDFLLNKYQHLDSITNSTSMSTFLHNANTSSTTLHPVAAPAGSQLKLLSNMSLVGPGVPNSVLVQLILLGVISMINIFLNALMVAQLYTDLPTVQRRHRLYTIVLAALDISVAGSSLSFSMMKMVEPRGVVKGGTMCSTWFTINVVSCFSSLLSMGLVLCDLAPLLDGGVEYKTWVMKRKMAALMSWTLVSSVFYFHAQIDTGNWSIDPGSC